MRKTKHFADDERVQRALSSLSGDTLAAETVRSLLQMRERDYGRGYATAVSDMIAVLLHHPSLKAQQRLELVQAFEAYMHEHRTEQLHASEEQKP